MTASPSLISLRDVGKVYLTEDVEWVFSGIAFPPRCAPRA